MRAVIDPKSVSREILARNPCTPRGSNSIKPFAHQAAPVRLSEDVEMPTVYECTR
jgi:hypothetical protein